MIGMRISETARAHSRPTTNFPSPIYISCPNTNLCLGLFTLNYTKLGAPNITGASTDYRDINGLTPLFYSILHRAELKVTQLLLNCMRDNSTSSAGAGQTGVTLGEAAGGKVIGISDHQGWQEVHHAAKLGLDAHLDKLLYHGCDINARISGSGNTPLHVAAINDQPQVIMERFCGRASRFDS